MWSSRLPWPGLCEQLPGSGPSLLPSLHRLMDPTGLLSLNLLLLLSLTFELSHGTGGNVLNCPKILRQLGSNVLLPLMNEGINKSMNKSTRILVTKAESPGSNVKTIIVSVHPYKEDSPDYVGNGYTFHLEDLSLGIRESRKEDEGWYFMALEENISVQNFCLQLRLYGNHSDYPSLHCRAKMDPHPKMQSSFRSKVYSELEAT